MNKTLERIAQEILNIHTLATRNNDSLDFHDLAVWRIKEALEAAYTAGQVAGKKQAESAWLTARTERS